MQYSGVLSQLQKPLKEEYAVWYIRDMKQPWLVLLIAFLATDLLANEEKQPLRLSRQEVQLLDDFLELKPGLSEDELRQRMPDLSDSYTDKDTRKLTAATSTFRLAGIEWRGRISMVDSKVEKAELHASARKEAYPKVGEQVLPQHQVRAIGLLISAHYTTKFGKVSECYVPNIDCPAGNPFGLRQQWHLKDLALAVEFSKNSSMSSLQISLADWTAWNKENREAYENSWPLKPAPKHLLLEVSSR